MQIITASNTQKEVQIRDGACGNFRVQLVQFNEGYPQVLQTKRFETKKGAVKWANKVLAA